NPRSVTWRTASTLNSSVYRLLLMDTSELAIFHGLEMSRKAWAYQLRFFGALFRGSLGVALLQSCV
uniref:hypothetical protein n=1 Tax=Xanthomonas axonopodis TaxID=53413 RepID=UPI0019D03D8A